MGGAGLGTATAAVGGGLMLLDSGNFSGGVYTIGSVMLVAGGVNVGLVTPLAAFGPLVSCRGLVTSGSPVSCEAGTVAVADAKRVDGGDGVLRAGADAEGIAKETGGGVPRSPLDFVGVTVRALRALGRPGLP